MTGETTSLARGPGAGTPPALSVPAQFLAFVRRPVLPERVTGITRAALAGVARLYLLDIALMAGLLALVALAMAGGFELPANQINSMTMTTGLVLLIVVAAPVLEEIAFRGWLSGRVGHVVACLSLTGALATSSLMAARPGADPHLVLYLLGLAVPLSVAALVYGRRRGPMRWFARAFPLFFALSSIGFALVHLANYQEGALVVLLPLVIPQLLAGAIFGFARVHYGLWASVLLHVLHNGSALGLIGLATLVG